MGTKSALARGLAGWVLLLSAAACPGSSDDRLPPLAIDDGCQPLLAPSDECMLPYPSDFWLVDDQKMPSGRRVQMSERAAVLTEERYSTDITLQRDFDGFSTTAPILTTFGVGLDLSTVIGILDDHAPTEGPSSTSILIEADTGRFISHYIDEDPRSEDPAHRVVVMRVDTPLREQTRYVVAYQGLLDTGGEPVAAPEGFARLRDGTVDQDPALSALAAHYEANVFGPLARAGVARGGLIQAWSFTTGSDMHAIGDMLRARELVLAELERAPPVVTITGVFDDGEDPLLWRTIFGEIEAPMVLVADQPGSELFYDEDGQVALNGSVRFPFTAIVPAKVRDGFAPAGALLYGHGFFGTRAEIENGATVRLLDRFGRVGFAIDWWGMSGEDIGEVVSTLGGDVENGLRFGERLVQAMMNWLSLTHAIKAGLVDDPIFYRPDEAGAVGVVDDPANPGADNRGAYLLDPERVDFLGISMGHILGGVMVALNPSIERAVLHVGGASFTQMMFRANPFNRFLFIMDFTVPDAYAQQKIAATWQMQFDRFDPARYAPYVLQRDLPRGPDGGRTGRSVLLQAGVGDTQVPNVTTVLHARALGIPQMSMSARTVAGLDVADDGLAGSALVLFDIGADDAFYAVAEPPDEESYVHNALRDYDEAAAQMATFLDQGVIENFCGGVCTLPSPSQR